MGCTTIQLNNNNNNFLLVPTIYALFFAAQWTNGILHLPTCADSVANSAVLQRNWASFRPVPRGKVSLCGLRFWGFFLSICRYFWASFKSGGLH